jgi:hypothetical protein
MFMPGKCERKTRERLSWQVLLLRDHQIVTTPFSGEVYSSTFTPRHTLMFSTCNIKNEHSSSSTP